MGKLIGYRRFTSKKGVPYCVATICDKCSERDNERGQFGDKVEDIFLPEDLIDFLEPKHIGHNVEVIYNISAGRAYVEDLIVK